MKDQGRRKEENEEKMKGREGRDGGREERREGGMESQTIYSPEEETEAQEGHKAHQACIASQSHAGVQADFPLHTYVSFPVWPKMPRPLILLTCF